MTLRLGCAPQRYAGGWTGLVLAALVNLLYAAGFHATGMAWPDALGASSAHVVPGAAVAILAWKCQRRLSPWPIWWMTVSHLVLAPLTGLTWLGLTLAVTWVLRPDLVASAVPAAAQGTIVSGVTLYLLVAVIFATLDARRRLANRDSALARAELARLRARIEPHFLFNTLETISALIAERPEAAEDAIARLGRILRNVVEQPEDEGATGLIPLADELALVQDYLAIARLRMGERLSVIESIDPDTLDLSVPAFCVQTLVENAVLHGFGTRVSGGTLSVSAMREDGLLVLVVADDGVGAEEQTILDGGNGLRLVRALLEACFPGRSTFDVASRPDLGVSVRLSMPTVEAA